MSYEILKLIHLLSMLLLLGIGSGSAFYKYMTDKKGSLEAIVHINKQVVLADWLFTTPSAILQPLSGIALAHLLGYSLTAPWILYSLILFGFSGILWLGAVYLQIQMRNLSIKALEQKEALPPLYHRYAKIWFLLGIPSFLAMFGVMLLMLFRGYV
ncbi:MAG: membrane protein [Sulfurovum sp. FS08-3]|nr:MAG: membrane protein [Sulfurovum sp. FS08-3]